MFRTHSRKSALIICLLLIFCLILPVSCSRQRQDDDAAQEDVTVAEVTEEAAPAEDTAQEDAAVTEEPAAEEESAEAAVTEEKKQAETEKKEEKTEKKDKKKKKTSSSGSSSSSSTDQAASTPASSAPAENKKWVDPVYKEVNHPEEGHYETQNTGRIKCCGKRSGSDGCAVYFDSMEAYKAHQEAYVEKKRKELDDPDYECQGDHAPAKYETKEVWVVDKPAWTEKVLVSEGHWE